MKNEKLVGIIYSPGFGAGWSTLGAPEMALDQELAHAIDQGLDHDKLVEIAEKNWPDEYRGGLYQCVVEWVKHGQEFRIDEYDGDESLVLENDFVSAIPNHEVV